MFRKYHFVSLIILVLLTITACSSHRPSPQLPDAAGPMIMVEGESLPTITFTNLITDIPGGRVIGYFHEGLEYNRGYEIIWNETYDNETSALNDLALDILGEAGYRIREGNQSQLRLEGTIRKLSLNTYSYKSSFDQAECEVRWHLFRAGEDSPFFTSATPGAGRVETGQPGAISSAFELALRRLLADEEFVQALESR